LNTQKQIFLIVVLLFVFTGGCAAYTVIDLPIRAVDQTQWHKDQSIERGALLFANNCRTCHGIQGQGGVGLPLNVDKFQDQDPLILKNNRALLLRTISCGRAGSLMPAWLNTNGGSLNAEQIQHLIDFITDPIDESGKLVDDQGNPTSAGWAQALEFAHNLNRETIVVVGGDTLDTIARDHLVGIPELLDVNPGLTAHEVLKEGAKINLPDGRTHVVRKANETLTKVADSEHVGAEIIAQLNAITYKLDAGKGTFAVLASDKSTADGLNPGATLALPANARYVIKAADTLDGIAKVHGVSASGIADANKTGLSTTDPTKALDSERKLKLPANPVAVVQPAQTLAVIASQHGLKVDDLAASSGIGKDTVLGAGQPVKLPDGTQYTIQTGDTLASAAAAHGIGEADLAQLNGLNPGDFISSQVIIAFPKVDKYVVQGQDLTAIAKTFSNVTAGSLGQAQNPPVPANTIYAVGTILILPADAWGSAPPNTVNTGTACIQNAVPESVYQQITGGTPSAGPTAPAEVSKDVTIASNASDWTVTADGKAQPANKGIVSVAKGTTVHFLNNVGIHTLTINGKDNEASWIGKAKKDIPFDEAGTFKITCTIHPTMLAYVFVQ